MDAPRHKHEGNETELPLDATPRRRTLVDRAAEIGNDPDREARWAKWREENADAIAAYNAWFEREGRRYLRPLQL